MKLTGLYALAAAPLLATPVSVTSPVSAAIHIADQAALNKALLFAKGGETLRLAPGDYAFKLTNKQFAAPLVVTSADPKTKARFSYLGLNDVSNIVFRQVEIGRAMKEGENTENTIMGKVAGGSDISFDQCYVHGSLDGDPRNDGIGLQIRAAKNVSVTNCEFEQLGRGGQFFWIDNVTVKGNHVHDIRSDGFDFSGIVGALIQGNRFQNWMRIKSDHPDAIQFASAGSKRSSTDIVVRDNVVLCSNGTGSQGIFMRDEGSNLPYLRITIENNFILGTNMPNGITVSHGDQVVIRNNSVLSPLDNDNPVWIRLGSDGPVTNLAMSGNIADSGGNRTASQALSSAQRKLLKKSRLEEIEPEMMTVAGIGWQP
jgi:hypothetical protein